MKPEHLMSGFKIFTQSRTKSFSKLEHLLLFQLIQIGKILFMLRIFIFL